jgi:hypothetical protein
MLPGRRIDEAVATSDWCAIEITASGVPSAVTLLASYLVNDSITTRLGPPAGGSAAVARRLVAVITYLSGQVVNHAIAAGLIRAAILAATVSAFEIPIITHFAGMAVQRSIATGAGDASVSIGGTEHPWGAEDPARTYRGIRDVHATTCCQEKRQRE